MSISARNKALLPGFIFLLLGMIFFMRFGAMMLVLIVVPSIVAFYIDHRPGRPSFKVIAACNIAAAVPFIVQIVDLSLRKQYSEAGQVMDSLQSWMFVYVGAAAGWGMLHLAKFVARIITLMHYDYAVGMLEKKQTILLKEWGEEILQTNTKKSKNN